MSDAPEVQEKYNIRGSDERYYGAPVGVKLGGVNPTMLEETLEVGDCAEAKMKKVSIP